MAFKMVKIYPKNHDVLVEARDDLQKMTENHVSLNDTVGDLARFYLEFKEAGGKVWVMSPWQTKNRGIHIDYPDPDGDPSEE